MSALVGARREPHRGRPERGCTSAHVFLLKALFRKTSAARALHRLGDPEWLGAAVDRPAPVPVWWAPKANRRLSAVIEDLGT